MARTITSGVSLIRPNLSIKDYYEKRNKVLIMRDTGGLGDILMCRMMFEDFKILMPDCHLVFACPVAYHDAVKDHPFIDEVVDSRKINENDYVISYNITAACGRYENSIAPMADKNRSDIWADHCGFQLTKHDMHLNVDESECRERLKQYSSKPIVLFAPISAIKSKNLDSDQMNAIVDGVTKLDCKVLGLHKQVIHELEAETVVPSNTKEFFAFVKAADYIITVDTAAFHVAGGLNKPTVAVFSWACGQTYGKHYKNFVLVQRHRKTNPEWTCGPCYMWNKCPKSDSNRKPCITEITGQEVVEAFVKLRNQYGTTNFARTDYTN